MELLDIASPLFHAFLFHFLSFFSYSFGFAFVISPSPAKLAWVASTFTSGAGPSALSSSERPAS